MLTRRGFAGFASCAICAATGFVATDPSVNASDRDQPAWRAGMPVVRISLGRFDAANYDAVRKLLDDSQKTLVPAIRRLKGNRAYNVGIDRENNAMTNVSVWDTRGDAEQMASTDARSGQDFCRGRGAFRKTDHQSRNALDDVILSGSTIVVSHAGLTLYKKLVAHVQRP
jgi:hypothetical protein